MPSRPRGLGLHPRVLWTIGLFTVFIVVFFVVSIYRASNQLGVITDAAAKPVDTRPVDKVVQTLAHQLNKKGPIVMSAKRPSQQATPTAEVIHRGAGQTQPKGRAPALLQEGGQAQIAVFKRSPVPIAANRRPSVEMVSAFSPEDAFHPNPDESGQQQAFLESSQARTDISIDSTLKPMPTPFTLQAGTIIPATMLTGIQSDLPGTMIAKVRRNVFDSTSGNFLLIPQGTTLVGRYDSQIAYGQSRVLIAWTRLLFPNGTSLIYLGNPAPI